MTTAPVNIGLIGLGPFWDNQYRAALAKLSQRLKVVAVYDNVRSRAEQAARETQSHVVGGITNLISRPDVHALLWLDAGWQGSAIVSMLLERRKPVLMGAKCDLVLSALQTAHQQATAHSQTFVPAFLKRGAPASIRLQELLATQLGRPQCIDINISPASLTTVPFATNADFGGTEPPSQDPLLEWVDWVQYLFRTAPQKVTSEDNGQTLFLEFAPGNATSETTTQSTNLRKARLSLSVVPPVPDQPTCDEIRLQCEKGIARLIGSSSIEWACGDDSNLETLATERTETEVLLDLFCRRVVGGIVPVPDLGDLIRAKQVVDRL